MLHEEIFLKCYSVSEERDFKISDWLKEFVAFVKIIHCADKETDCFVTAQDAKKAMITCNHIPPGETSHARVWTLTPNMTIFGNEIRDALARNHSFSRKKKTLKNRLQTWKFSPEHLLILPTSVRTSAVLPPKQRC